MKDLYESLQFPLHHLLPHSVPWEADLYMDPINTLFLLYGFSQPEQLHEIGRGK